MTRGVDWSHPSVRDTVIGYLIDHESERHRFLSSTGVSGAILALSTAGGAEGKRQLPLLQTDTDWSILVRSCTRLAKQGTGNAGLFQAVSIAAEVSSKDERKNSYVQALARRVLSAARDGWDSAECIIPSPHLRAFYSACLTVGIWEPSPNLAATWDDARDQVRSRLEERWLSENDLEALEESYLLLRLIEDSEPRFVRIRLHHGDDPREEIPVLLELLRGYVESLEDLDSNEDIIHVDDGVEFSAPVQPEPNENRELSWLTSAEILLDVLKESRFLSDLRVADLLNNMEDHISTRRDRQSRWEEFEYPDPDLVPEPRSQGSGDFDIGAFFSDL